MKRARNVSEIWNIGDPTGLSNDIRSAFYELPDRTFFVAGLRDEAFAAQFQRMSVQIRGADVAYVFMQNQAHKSKRYGLSCAVVEKNGDPIGEHPVRLSVISPARSLFLNSIRALRSQGGFIRMLGKNWSLLSEELTRRNPRWIISTACNKAGLMPEFYEELICLNESQKRLEYLVLTEPGKMSFADDVNEPLMAESFARQKLGHGGSLRLYRKKNHKWEDCGIFISNRLGGRALAQKQTCGDLSPAEFQELLTAGAVEENQWVEYRGRVFPSMEFDSRQLEQYEIKQMGAQEYLFRVSQAIGSRDVQTLRSIFWNRPALIWAFYQFQQYGFIPRNWRTESPADISDIQLTLRQSDLMKFCEILELESITTGMDWSTGSSTRAEAVAA